MSQPRPALLKWMRRELRGNPALSAEELAERWQAHSEQRGAPATDADLELVRQLQDEEASAAAERAAAPNRGDVGRGCGLALVLNAAVFVGLIALSFALPAGTGFLPVVFIGVLQVIYMLPVGIWLWRSGHTATLQ